MFGDRNRGTLKAIEKYEKQIHALKIGTNILTHDIWLAKCGMSYVSASFGGLAI